jgi:hypothetical protein
MIKVTGKIIKKFDSVVFGTFEKRILWLEEVTERFPNTWQLECWKDDVKMLDSYNEGDYVTCYIDIKGKLIPKDKSKNGDEWVSNTLKCWNVEKDGKSYKEIKV